MCAEGIFDSICLGDMAFHEGRALHARALDFTTDASGRRIRLTCGGVEAGDCEGAHEEWLTVPVQIFLSEKASVAMLATSQELLSILDPSIFPQMHVTEPQLPSSFNGLNLEISTEVFCKHYSARAHCQRLST